MSEKLSNLDTYKGLIRLLGGYIEAFPATGLEKLFRTLLDVGVKCIPKDKKALEILTIAMRTEPPAAINKLVNGSFVDLLDVVVPMYKTEDGKAGVASWKSGDKVSNKIIDLIAQDGKTGHWSDSVGTKVSLIATGGI